MRRRSEKLKAIRRHPAEQLSECPPFRWDVNPVFFEDMLIVLKQLHRTDALVPVVGQRSGIAQRVAAGRDRRCSSAQRTPAFAKRPVLLATLRSCGDADITCTASATTGSGRLMAIVVCLDLRRSRQRRSLHFTSACYAMLL